jgi:enoyl-CoA hydratase
MIFNNPDRRNALSLDMWEGISAILESFHQDESVRVVVIKGAMDKAFVSGAGISWFDDKRSNEEQVAQYAAILSRAREHLVNFDKPFITMSQRYCLDGGMTVALNADIRIASDAARFDSPAARMGFAYGYESVKHLVDLVGPSYAKEIIFRKTAVRRGGT